MTIAADNRNTQIKCCCRNDPIGHIRHLRPRDASHGFYNLTIETISARLMGKRAMAWPALAVFSMKLRAVTDNFEFPRRYHNAVSVSATPAIKG